MTDLNINLPGDITPLIDEAVALIHPPVHTLNMLWALSFGRIDKYGMRQIIKTEIDEETFRRTFDASISNKVEDIQDFNKLHVSNHIENFFKYSTEEELSKAYAYLLGKALLDEEFSNLNIYSDFLTKLNGLDLSVFRDLYRLSRENTVFLVKPEFESNYYSENRTEIHLGYTPLLYDTNIRTNLTAKVSETDISDSIYKLLSLGFLTSYESFPSSGLMPSSVPSKRDLEYDVYKFFINTDTYSELQSKYGNIVTCSGTRILITSLGRSFINACTNNSLDSIDS